jgi:ABC-type transporter MlaC component
MNDIYIGGGNINSIIKDNMTDYLEKIKSNRAKIHLMKDGLRDVINRS